ncbi:MAG: TAXI family TRAP transporter solute-binding subunit [Acidobacteriota bacterium]|jgi:TRAP transporter TAXI family solute receptor
MLRRLLAPLVLLVMLTSPACGGPSVQFLSIGTGGTGGIYYPLGGAIAAMLSAADSSRQYTAEVTGGSVENIARVASGEIDMGFTLGASARAAFDGGDGMEAVPALRIVAPLYPNVTHVLVREDSGIVSVADFAGKTVSVGSAGSGTEQFSRHLLEAYGLDYDDIDERYLSFSESSAALRDGAIDAAVLSVGYPAAAVLEATTNAAVTLLPIDAVEAERLHAARPYYTQAVIPAGTYAGLDTDLPTIAAMNWMVGLDTLDDATVTALLDALRDRRDELIRVNEIARQIDLAALAEAPIPLHPATQRWLEAGR